VGSPAAIPSFFDGVPAEDVADILGRLELRRFPAGSIVFAEGDYPGQIYVAESGTAEAFVADRNGTVQRVGHITPGTTVGEMSLFTGQPASATVRALDDLDVRVLSEAEFARVADAHPMIYRNLAGILAERLARTNRLAVRGAHGKVAVLRGGSPLEAYALACSVAWHSRQPTVLLAPGGREALASFAGRGGPGVDVLFDAAANVADLAAVYDHVLVHGVDAPAVEAPVVDIPNVELQAADDQNLRDGLLPISTPAGRALGRTARRLTGLTVGLALGAGSLRGYAHVGVLRGLRSIGLEPDFICGTSIGGAVGAAYACGNEPDEIAVLLDRCAKTTFRPTVPIKGFMSSAPLGRILKEIYAGKSIEELEVPLGIVAADLPTQQEVVFRRGLVWRAVLASVSIPGVYPAQRMGRYTLVDGGVVNSLPVGAAADMGADIVIAVRLLSPGERPENDALAVESSESPPAALSVLLRSIEIMQSRTTREARAAAVTIVPELSAISGGKLRQFADGRRYIDAGESALEAALPRIASVLPWMGA
jgi:NTE family protein